MAMKWDFTRITLAFLSSHRKWQNQLVLSISLSWSVGMSIQAGAMGISRSESRHLLVPLTGNSTSRYVYTKLASNQRRRAFCTTRKMHMRGLELLRVRTPTWICHFFKLLKPCLCNSIPLVRKPHFHTLWNSCPSTKKPSYSTLSSIVLFYW